MEINFWWIAIIVLYTIIVSAHHYFIYTDRQLNISLRGKNILYRFLYREYLLVSNELKIVAGLMFACVWFLLFIIALPLARISDICFNISCWYRTRHCHDENKEYELELDPTIPAEEQIRACGIQKLYVDACELAELINGTEIKGRAIVRLIKMEKLMTFQSRLQLLDSRGLKPADPIHLLAFTQKFPEIWKEVRLYAFGMPGKRSPNEKSFLCLGKLYCALDVKSLGWTTPDNEWLSSDYFGRILTVPKDC